LAGAAAGADCTAVAADCDAAGVAAFFRGTEFFFFIVSGEIIRAVQSA
jgi:hypothetical protein